MAGGSFSDFMAEQDEAGRINRPSLLAASQLSPEEAGEAQRLAPAAGLPAGVVARNLDEVRKQKQQRDFETFLQETELGPLASDTDFLAVAQDAAEELSSFKRTVNNIRASVKRVIGGFGVGMGALSGELGAALDSIQDTAIAELEQSNPRAAAELRARVAEERARRPQYNPAASEGMQLLRESQREFNPLFPFESIGEADGWLGKTGATLGFVTETALTSLPEMVASLLSPVSVGVSYSGQIAAERAGRRTSDRRGDASTSDGLAMPEAQDFAMAAPAAAAMALLNRFGADRVLNVFRGLEQTAIRRIGTAAFAEGITEVTEEEIRYIAERAGIDPIEVHEMLALVPPALLGGAGAGGMVRAGLEGISLAVRRLEAQREKANIANEHEKMLGELTALAEAAKVRERNPEQLEKFLSALDPTTEIYVDSDALMQSDLDLPEPIQKRIEEAAQTNVPVRFTAAEYATYLWPAAETLNKKARVGSADALNAEEAEKVESEFKARADAVNAMAEQAEAQAAEAEQIQQQVQAQIVSTGRFREDVASAYASLVRDFYVTTAARAGMTPAQLYQRYPLRIQAEGGTGGLDQPDGGMPALTPEMEAQLQPVASLADEAGELPAGYTRFRHFGKFKVPTLDPAFMGTGLKGAERARLGAQVLSLYPDQGFEREVGTGNIEYVVDVPTSKLYDVDADPMNLRQQARQQIGFYGDGTPIYGGGIDFTQLEHLIRDAGFVGYVRPNAEGNLRGQARLFYPVPVVGGRRDPASQIPRADELPADMREVETRFAEWLANNYDEAVRQYNALEESQGGRVLNTDIARELSPDYRANRGLSAAVHEPASWFINKLYAQRLKEAPKGNVLFTAGGTGAGKSSALRGKDLETWPIIYDTNIAKASSGRKKIDQALAAGREVDVYYVFADPLDAFQRAVKRTQRMAKELGTGRTVPLWAHVGSHVGSRKAIPELMEHYAEDERVAFSVMFNEPGKGAREVDIAELPELSYDHVREVVEGELESQYKAGKISKAEYQAFRAEGATEATGATEASGAAGRQVGPGESELQGTVVNIGLATNDGTGITPEQVRAAFESRGIQIEREALQQSDTEPTLVLRLSRPLTQEEGDAISAELKQEAIAHVSDGQGALFGPQAENWGPFNPEFFMTFDGRRLSEVIASQALQQSARGSILLGRDMQATPSLITLMEKADLSTFLHESGHFFFEVLTDLAAREGAPAEIVADAQELFKWVGWKGTAAEWRNEPINNRREAHEKFARGFEAWLLEGKAPTPEQRKLFHRFRAWLLNIYRSLTQLNVQLTDEVRGVMGRMLATREMIKAAEAERAMQPLFTDQMAAGMTPEEWQSYQENWAEASQIAQDQLQARSLRNMRWLANAKARELAKLQKENEAKRAAVRAEVEAEIAQRPERVAETLILTGEAHVIGADGTPQVLKIEGPHKLSTERLSALYGSTEDYRAVAADAGFVDVSAIRAPWHALPKNFVAKTGVDPDELAEMVGMTSGDQLVNTLLTMAPREQLIEQMTDARVLERYGDLNNAREMERAVDIALHNQMRTRVVAAELAALEKATSAGARDAWRRAAREHAERVIRRRKVRDLRPGQFAAAEARASRAASEALAAGDSKLAAQRKRDQLFNGYASREASRAQERVEKGLVYLRKFSQLGTRKNLDPAYRDQIDKLLERFDLRNRPLREIDKRDSLLKWIEAQREQGHEPAIPDELLDEAQRTHYRNLTVEQFEGLVDAVKNIEHLARLKNKLLKNKRQKDFIKARDELVKSIEKHAPPAKNVELERDMSALGRAGQLITDWLTSLRKLSSLVRIMDGGADGGLAWEYFVRPLNEAADVELKMRADATKKLNALMDKVPGLNPGVFARIGRKVTGGPKLFIPAINRSLSLEARLAVALNWGNEGNRQRLIDGNKWTPNQVQAIIDTLSKQEMEFVQGVFDLIGSYWNDIKAKEQRVTGVAPEAVTPMPIHTRHGTFRGGYYPIVADPMRSDRAVQQNDAELIAQSLRGAVGRATTRRGHTKERVGGKDPVRLDLAVIPQHLSQVTHDLAWHETLIDYNKMLRDPEVSGLIRERYGPETTAAMRRVADDVARGEVAARTASERILNHLRVGSTIVGLGLSVTSTLLQITGFSQSIVRVGYRPMASGILRYMAHPVETTKQVYAKSEFMQSRSMARNRELSDIFNRLDGKKRPAAALYFMPIQALQTVVDVPTWLGAYNKALQNGETDERAVHLADQAVRDSQSSGQVHDLAEVQRNGPLMKLLTNFYSYFSSTYQLAVESGKAFGREKSVGAAVKLATDYLMLFTVPVIFSALLKQGLRGDEDEDELAVKLVKEHVSYALGMYPLVRELSGAIEGMDYRGPAGLSFFGDATALVKQASQGEVDEAFLRALNRTAGTLLHYPAGQVDRTVRGMVAVAEGDAGPQAVLVGPPVER